MDTGRSVVDMASGRRSARAISGWLGGGAREVKLDKGRVTVGVGQETRGKSAHVEGGGWGCRGGGQRVGRPAVGSQRQGKFSQKALTAAWSWGDGGDSRSAGGRVTDECSDWTRAGGVGGVLEQALRQGTEGRGEAHLGLLGGYERLGVRVRTSRRCRRMEGRPGREPTTDLIMWRDLLARLGDLPLGSNADASRDPGGQLPGVEPLWGGATHRQP